MKLTIKDSVISIGIIGSMLITFYLALEPDKLPKIKDEIIKNKQIEIPEEEVYALENIYVFDMKYQEGLVKFEGVNPDNRRYFIMNEINDINYIAFKDILNINSYGFINIERDYLNKTIIEGSSYMRENLFTKFINIDGIISLKDFLRNHNLDNYIFDSYTKDNLAYLLTLINDVEQEKININDILVASTKYATNYNLDKKLFFMTLKNTSLLDEELIKISNDRFKRVVNNYMMADLLDNSYKIILTKDEDRRLITVFPKNSTKYETASLNTGLILKDLKTFLEELNLNDLIKEEYTKEELNDIYEYVINLDNLTRVRK